MVALAPHRVNWRAGGSRCPRLLGRWPHGITELAQHAYIAVQPIFILLYSDGFASLALSRNVIRGYPDWCTPLADLQNTNQLPTSHAASVTSLARNRPIGDGAG